MPIYRHIYIHIIFTYMCILMHIYIYTYFYIYIYVHVHQYIYYIFLFLNITGSHRYICTYAHTHTHVSDRLYVAYCMLFNSFLMIVKVFFFMFFGSYQWIFLSRNHPKFHRFSFNFSLKWEMGQQLVPKVSGRDCVARSAGCQVHQIAELIRMVLGEW